MRPNIRFFVELASKKFNLMEPIVEIGSFIVQGQEELANLRPIFFGKEFIGCDMRKGNGVDILENVESLTFKDNSVGTILILDTIEHIENNFLAFNEIYRVLKNDGIVIATSVMDFPIHDFPSDYWRFTPGAMKLLLKKFPIRIIGHQGNNIHPHTVFGIGIKSEKADIFKNICDTFIDTLKYKFPQNKPSILTKIFYSLKVIMNTSFDNNMPAIEYTADIEDKIYHHTNERVCPDLPDYIFQNHLKVYQFAEQFVKGKVVLDVGCGTGYGAHYFTTHGGATLVSAFDNSVEAITYAKRKYSNPYIDFVQMDAQNITYPNNSFDIVFSSENLEHLQDPEKNIAHIRRVLKSGGILILGTPNKEISSPELEKSSNLYHIKEFCFEELEELLNKYFRFVYIFENNLPSSIEAGRKLKEDRRRRGKIGIEPGTKSSISLGKLTVDLKNLNNSHSFMAIAW